MGNMQNMPIYPMRAEKRTKYKYGKFFNFVNES